MNRSQLATLAALLVAFGASATELTDAQIDAAFSKADSDKSGTVSLAEAKRFGIREKVFRKANPDKDGSLDKKEFASAIAMQFAMANKDDDETLDRKEAVRAGVKSKKVFDNSNPDKDGTLDISEYLAALMAQAK